MRKLKLRVALWLAQDLNSDDGNGSPSLHTCICTSPHFIINNNGCLPLHTCRPTSPHLTMNSNGCHFHFSYLSWLSSSCQLGFNIAPVLQWRPEGTGRIMNCWRLVELGLSPAFFPQSQFGDTMFGHPYLFLLRIASEESPAVVQYTCIWCRGQRAEAMAGTPSHEGRVQLPICVSVSSEWWNQAPGADGAWGFSVGCMPATPGPLVWLA